MMTLEQSVKNEMLYLRLIVFFLCSLFLLGVPYIAMLFLLTGTGLFVAQSLVSLRIDRHPAAFGLLLIYVLSWGMMVDGFHPASLLDPRFLGGEGRIIIAYMPVFLIFAAPRRLFSDRNMMRLFRIAFYVTLAVVPLSLVGLNKALFGSHHAAGYAAGSVLIMFACLSSELKLRWMRFGLLTAVILLMLANSRTTILGLTMAFATFYYYRLLTPKTIVVGGIALVAIIYTWSFLSPSSFARLSQIFEPRLWQDIAQQAAAASAFDVMEVGNIEQVGSNHNVLTRIILWVKAWGYFQASPILGIGTFRFNDPGLYFVEIMPMLTVVASDMTPSVGIATAHNSYFQVLAEGGLFGMVMYLFPWFLMLRTLRQNRGGTPVQHALRNMGILAILFMGFGALTGHLLAAPSMTLWASLFASLAVRSHALANARRSTELLDQRQLSAVSDNVRRP